MNSPSRSWQWLFLGAALLGGVLFGLGMSKAAFFWACGVALGYSAQRSRLCFAGAIRDLLLWRLSALARAVLALLAMSLLGVTAAQRWAGAAGNVFPVGLGTVAGGFLFGLGMGLAGVCALTTLVRLGEGISWHGFTLLGLILGGEAGLRLQPWWEAKLGPGVVVFLPQLLGWPLGLLIPWAVLVTLYFRLGRPAAKRREGS